MAHISEYAACASIPTITVEWGSTRQQGKRVGKRVMGAMADPPRGQRTYRDFAHADGMTPEIYAEVRLMEDELKVAVIGAIQSGVDPDIALRLAYEAMD